MHMSFRKTLLAVGAAFALAPAAPAMATQEFGDCQLDGLATFASPLTVNQGTPLDWGPAFGYTFNGDLTECNFVFSGGYNGGSGGGKIYAGEGFTLDGVAYDWPAALAKPSGNGGCTGSHTDGTALVFWDEGPAASVIEYSTDGAAAAVGLTGTFGSKTITLASKAKNADGSPVSTRTIVADAFADDYTGGPLAFAPDDPTQCNGAGVTEAPISGVIGHGNYE
jgi:hypothetical protein